MTTQRRYPDLLLFPQHEALLAASGIAAEVAAARGYRSADTKAALERLGFTKAQCRVPALVLPIHSVTGAVVLHQIRPDDPRVSRNSKRVKYETPTAARIALDVHPMARPSLADPAVPLWITEGTRKVDSAISHGLCCIGVLGVWGWRGRNEQGGRTALPDWEAVALKGRTVYLAFDSDAMTKRQVQKALLRFHRFLESRGARVRIVGLPSGPDGSKVGLDDYLAIGHSIQDLLALAKPDLRDPPKEAPSAPMHVANGTAKPDVSMPDPTPWPTPVDGPGLVEAVVEFFTRYVVLPAGAPLVVALWAIATWLADDFDAFPYLAVTSPQKRCGKTRVLELLERVCRRSLSTTNISEAALFRVIDQVRPTLLIDEAQYLRTRDERCAALHDLLCAGIRRGNTSIRMGGPHRDEVRRFSVFCPKAIALIGKMTDILMDRAIAVTMRRRTPREHIERFFFARAASESEPLRQRAVRWAADHHDEIRAAYVTAPLPEGVEDREAELWAPLLAVARVALPAHIDEVESLAKGAANAKAVADDAIGVRLLADLLEIFDDHLFLPTKEIIDALVAMEDAAWPEYRGGKPITPRGLAALLKPFGIDPEKARHEGQAGVRGYWRRAFHDAWERYIPPSLASDPPQGPHPLQDKGYSAFDDPPRPPSVADAQTRAHASGTSPVADVADGRTVGTVLAQRQSSGTARRDSSGMPPDWAGGTPTARGLIVDGPSLPPSSLLPLIPEALRDCLEAGSPHVPHARLVARLRERWRLPASSAASLIGRAVLTGLIERPERLCYRLPEASGHDEG
ncbi:MAG TPA: DUF3631 domain-containing protein [bacterium]|nr:DUF3631 domain-containing protein [bacterium]